MLLNKINHIGRCNSLQRNSFNPLSEIICGNKNMSFARWWVDLTDEINTPSSERPRFDNRIHSRCGCPLNIDKHVISLASFEIFKTIFKNGRPIIPISSNHPFHFESWLMCSTHSFTDFTYQSSGFIITKTSEQNFIHSTIIQFIIEEHILSGLKSNMPLNFLRRIF